MNALTVENKSMYCSGYAGGSILIVDDDIDFADGLADILKLNSYDVNITASIVETLASIDRYKPDIALIDLKLGLDNGIELISKLKKQWNPALVCIVITAYADVDTAMQAIREGADNYLQKPIRKETILAELKRSYDKIQLQRENEKINRRLRRNEKLLNEAQRIAQLGSWEHDLVSNEMIWSYGLCQLLETDTQESCSSREQFLALVHPEDQSYVMNTYNDAVLNVLPYEIEHRLLFDKDRVKYVRQQCEVACDETGKAISTCGTILDITDRKREEMTLQNIAKWFSATSGEEFFLALTKHIGDTLNVDYALVGSLVEDDSGSVDTVAVYNRGNYLEPFKYKLTHTPCQNVITGRTSCIYTCGVRKYYPHDQMLADLGIESYAGSPLFDSSGNVLGIIIVLDKNPLQYIKRTESLIEIYANRAAAELERLRYEKYLRQNEEKFRSLIEHGPDGIVMISPAGIIDIVNRQLEIMSGYARTELTGKHIDLLIPPRYKLQDKLGQHIPDLQTSRNIARNWKVILTCNDGMELPVEISLNPLMTEQGVFISMEIHDLSNRIRAEHARKALEEELFRSQKLEAIGQLTGGIAHDFNNILTSILGYVRLALRHNNSSGNLKLTEYLSQIKHGGERAADLVRQMLAYSRNVPEKIEIQELQPIINNTLKLLRPALPKTIDIKFRQTCETFPVKLDAAQFEQMLMNLCINARDAMHGNGDIGIYLSHISFDSMICDSCHKNFSGLYINLAVQDTGTGITDEQILRIFDPFYTTKETTKGSGLGLSMVHGAMHAVNGHILVDSIPGEGSTFNLVFPAMQAENRNPILEAPGCEDVPADDWRTFRT